MYRQNDRTKRSPIVVEYVSKRIRAGFLFLAVVIVAIGASMLGGMHASHVSCSRSAVLDNGICQIRRYGLTGSIDEVLPASDIASFEVTIRTNSKGRQYADTRLVMSRESHRSAIELETGSWSPIDPKDALAARSELESFQRGLAMSADIWLMPHLVTMAYMLAFGLGFIAFGVVSLREQLGQLRPIRIVIDPEREVVIMRRQEIPWSEIAHVDIEGGRALYWASGKNEYIPGHRLRFVRRSGPDIPATKEFRAGDPTAHERARRTILRALGRDCD